MRKFFLLFLFSFLLGVLGGQSCDKITPTKRNCDNTVPTEQENPSENICDQTNTKDPIVNIDF